MAELRDRLIYRLSKILCLLFLKIHNRLGVAGLDRMPETRPFVVAANHCSNLDPVVVGSAFPFRLRYLAKVELFQGSRIFAWLIRHLGAIPVSRGSAMSAGGALKTFLQLLQGGESVLLFPEGSRSLDGRVKPLEGGVALLALKTGAPVVPVYVSGTFQAMPTGSSRIGWNRISVTFGEALYPPSPTGGRSSREARVEFLKALEESLMSMEASALASKE